MRVVQPSKQIMQMTTRVTRTFSQVVTLPLCEDKQVWAPLRPCTTILATTAATSTHVTAEFKPYAKVPASERPTWHAIEWSKVCCCMLPLYNFCLGSWLMCWTQNQPRPRECCCSKKYCGTTAQHNKVQQLASSTLWPFSGGTSQLSGIEKWSLYVVYVWLSTCKSAIKAAATTAAAAALQLLMSAKLYRAAAFRDGRPLRSRYINHVLAFVCV